MSDETLEQEVAAYLAQPVTGERIPSTHPLSPGLLALLPRLAAERGVSVDSLLEYLLFKQIRFEQARRLVGDSLDPVPASFADERVARAKVEVAREVAAERAAVEERGDKAARLADELEATLQGATGEVDPEIEALNRRVAEADARVDQALGKKRP